MTNVVGLNVNKKDGIEYKVIPEFNLGDIEVVIPISTKLYNAKDVALDLLADGMTNVIVSLYLNYVTECIYDKVLFPSRMLSTLSICTEVGDDEHWFYISKFIDIEDLKNLAMYYHEGYEKPNPIVTVTVDNYTITDNDEWRMRLKTDEVPNIAARCNLEFGSAMELSQLVKMVSNLEEFVTINGGVLKVSRTDDWESALISAYIPYTSEYAIRILLQFDGTIDEVDV